MSKTLVTITKRGEVIALKSKLNLRDLGMQKITRSSLIEWDEENQGWYIVLLSYHGKKETVGSYLWECYVRELPSMAWTYSDLLLFCEYEDAVSAEIKLIQEIRRKEGIHAA